MVSSFRETPVVSFPAAGQELGILWEGQEHLHSSLPSCALLSVSTGKCHRVCVLYPITTSRSWGFLGSPVCNGTLPAPCRWGFSYRQMEEALRLGSCGS